MRRFYICTNMVDNLLHLQEEVLNKHNVQPHEQWEIDVFDDEDRLLCILKSENHLQ
jgi:hypothetical protein